MSGYIEVFTEQRNTTGSVVVVARRREGPMTSLAGDDKVECRLLFSVQLLGLLN